MLQEVAADTGAVAMRGDLSAWARQGVLLLNTSLTVEDGKPQKPRGSRLGAADRCAVATCRGAAAADRLPALGRCRPAQARADRRRRHRVLTANHPSPLSARRPPEPFIGCRHFTRVNRLLASCGRGRRPYAGDWYYW
jgi:uracil-DNA glycosylase